MNCIYWCRVHARLLIYFFYTNNQCSRIFSPPPPLLEYRLSIYGFRDSCTTVHGVGTVSKILSAPMNRQRYKRYTAGICITDCITVLPIPNQFNVCNADFETINFCFHTTSANESLSTGSFSALRTAIDNFFPILSHSSFRTIFWLRSTQLLYNTVYMISISEPTPHPSSRADYRSYNIHINIRNV